MELIAHIGLPKAGSTTLQRYLFSKLHGINYIGRWPQSNVGNDLSYPDLPSNSKAAEAFHAELSMNKQFNKELALKSFHEMVKDLPEGKPVLYSSEFLTGVFFSNPNIKEKLARLKDIGFNKVVLTLRKHSSIIKSQYRDHPFEPSDLVHGKSISLEKWIEEAHNLPYSYITSLQYNLLLQKLHDLFGEENVHVDLMEELSANPSGFIQRLCDFIKIPAPLELGQLPIDNTGVSQRYNTIRRLKKRLFGELPISKVFPKPLQDVLRRQLKKGEKEKLAFTESSREFLRSHFLDSNIELINSGFDSMRKHGYDQF